MSQVVVLGSINVDLVMQTRKMPRIGETILSDNIDYFIGGKGANQAVAAARVGGEVSLIGLVGDDTFGVKAYKHLGREGINVESVNQLKNMFTGVATIFKLPNDNSIVVAAGANGLLDPEFVNGQYKKISTAKVLLTQLEIPIVSVEEGLKIAKKSNVMTILNPAPYNAECIRLLPYVDIITPNEIEFEGLYGKSLESDQELEEAMLEWSYKYNTILIVTRGEKGVTYVSNNKLITIPTINVTAIDTTGAGDTFNGILATSICKNIELDEAIKMAGIGASLSITKYGAQVGMPTLNEIKKYQ